MSGGAVSGPGSRRIVAGDQAERCYGVRGSGLAAVMVTDTANFRNPQYHQPSDTLDTSHLDFMSQVVTGVMAAVTQLARVGAHAA